MCALFVAGGVPGADTIPHAVGILGFDAGFYDLTKEWSPSENVGHGSTTNDLQGVGGLIVVGQSIC